MNREGKFQYHDPRAERTSELPFADRLKNAGIYVANSANYKTITQDHPCIVMFYADWCPHCHRMEDPLRQVVEFANMENQRRNKYQYRVVAVDSEKNPSLADDMNPPVSGFPTLYIYDKTGRNYIPYNGDRKPQLLWNALSRY
jgi:protein disulfide-isomerase